MVNSCCVYGCSNRSTSENKGLAFHRLPTQKKLLRLWLIAMKTESVKVNQNTRVCGAHFPEGRRTREHPIPSIFPWSSRKRRKPPARRRAPVEQAAEPQPAQCSTSDSDTDPEEQSVYDESLFLELPAAYLDELSQL